MFKTVSPLVSNLIIANCGFICNPQGWISCIFMYNMLILAL